ncbi:hypothetical protein [Kitasatospora sp. NPDC085464]|uniref:hypothetical protein n=1 Tax=Kitasatospora sp. NPDC085464 TaxID=3364063 RepID=UPI0037CA7187
MKTRTADFTITVDLTNDGFLRTPREEQHNWLVGRATEELAADLTHLDTVARRLVTGTDRPAIRNTWSDSRAEYDDSQLIIEDQQVMQDWETPLMAAMARCVTRGGGDVLELGFGMGISATRILREGVRSYTVIEANADVQERFADWAAARPGQEVRLVPGRWQDVLDGLGEFDGIFFDTYPADEEEYLAYVVDDVTFAAHFFPHAAAHLRPGGVFTYYSNEIDSLGRGHQRALLEHFSSFSVEVVRDLKPPADCHYWWADSMVVVKAIK